MTRILGIRESRRSLPALAETEFGVVQGSMAHFAFVAAFGAVNAAMNFLSGPASHWVGRQKVLLPEREAAHA